MPRVASILAIVLGASIFGTAAAFLPWLLLQPGRREGSAYATWAAICIQFLLFPISLLVGTIARSALVTASISSAVVIALVIASIVLSDSSQRDLFAGAAIGGSLFLHLMVSVLWRKKLNEFPFNQLIWPARAAS